MLPSAPWLYSSYLRETALYVLLAAVLLDLLLGDPEGWPHPVRAIGQGIAWLDRLLMRPLLTKEQQLARGALLGLAYPAFLTLLVSGLLYFFYRLALPLFWALRILLAWQLLALKNLAAEAQGVARVLQTQGLEAGRRQVSRIVGRETQDLSEEEVVKATVETVAENFNDGFVAPLCFLVLLDVPGLFFFKCVNTLDSMVGYRNARYLYFGRVSARLDDILNFLPARLAALLLLLGAPLAGLSLRAAWRTFRRDRGQHLSPNSGQTEAVMAGALGIQLGGTHIYHGKAIVKPKIGEAGRPAETADIGRSVQLLYLAASLAVLLASLALLILR